jgi:hypothetical protein
MPLPAGGFISVVSSLFDYLGSSFGTTVRSVYRDGGSSIVTSEADPNGAIVSRTQGDVAVTLATGRDGSGRRTFEGRITWGGVDGVALIDRIEATISIPPSVESNCNPGGSTDPSWGACGTGTDPTWGPCSQGV